MGSIKSNIGHLEGASGIVSIIKSAMILEKGFVLPNLNFQKPNQNIPLAEWKMKVRFCVVLVRIENYYACLRVLGQYLQAIAAPFAKK